MKIKTAVLFVFSLTLLPSLFADVKVTCTRPSHKYAGAEKAEFEVTSSVAGTPVRVMFSRAYLPPLETVVTTTPARVSYALGEPGFIVCTAVEKLANGKDGKSAQAGAGFDPEKIRTALPPPKDFDEFWKRAFAEQDAIDPDFKVVPCENGVRMVSCATVRGMRMYAFLHIPKTPKPCAMKVSIGGGDSICNVASAVSSSKAGPFRDRAFLSIHLPPYEPAKDSVESGKRNEQWCKDNKTGALYLWKDDAADPRDRWFYRCILGSCRLIDYAARQPGVDSKKIYYGGSSTGGGFGILLAAFTPHFCAAFCEVPNYGNMGGPAVGRPTGEDGRGKHWQTSLYYDGGYLAPRIKCPIWMTCGYTDNACCPETIYCIYNSLTCEKVMFDKVENGHGDCPPGYYPKRTAWVESHLAR